MIWLSAVRSQYDLNHPTSSHDVPNTDITNGPGLIIDVSVLDLDDITLDLVGGVHDVGGERALRSKTEY